MPNYSRPLGDSIRNARKRLGMTQSEIADAIGIDPRTVLNIENYKGNPKMEVLYPLIRWLKLDAREIFTPEVLLEKPAVRQLKIMIDGCNDSEVQVLIPVVEAILSAMRNAEATDIGDTE